MWPKLIAQLMEVLPHVTRLIPMADMFFASKSASEKASQAALQALGEDVRTELGKVTAAHESLYRQLQEHSAQIAAVATDVRSTRTTIESHADRIASLEKAAARITLWVQAAVALLVVILCFLIAVLLRLH
jgi:septal ring factor EnvC (AmiA/AmiB activator)